MIPEELLAKRITNKGENLFDLSMKQPVLLIFLRHIGCVFCQEAIKDIREQKEEIRKRGVKIVFVHMAESEEGSKYLEELNLYDIDHISDVSSNMYEEFGLIKTNTRELFSFQVLLKSAESSLVRGNWPSLSRIGDGFQMPGVFLIENGIVMDSYIHKKISDRPNYSEIVNCCIK